jgi:hypothetical protein
MNGLTQRQKLWRTFPIIGILIWEWEVWRKERRQPCYRLWQYTPTGQKKQPESIAHIAVRAPDGSVGLALAPEVQGDAHLLPYPIDMWPLLDLPGQIIDETGVVYTLQTDVYPGAYHPTDIAQYALVHWNAYLKTKDEQYRQTFMTQARWLVTHETRIAENAGGWPLPFPNQEFHATEPWLSALTQGVGISVLVRAYQITGEDIFMQSARRAVHTFELDILDGGVSCPVGNDGVFFEEVAVYPAAHILNGYILSLFGVYDYVALTNDARIRALIERSLATLHTLIDDFDLGYGSRYDLLSKSPTNRFYHALHVTLLDALAHYSGCQHCTVLAARWAHYQHGFKPLLNHLVRRTDRYRRAFRRLLYSIFRGNPAREETRQGKIV